MIVQQRNNRWYVVRLILASGLRMYSDNSANANTMQYAGITTRMLYVQDALYWEKINLCSGKLDR